VLRKVELYQYIFTAAIELLSQQGFDPVGKTLQELAKLCKQIKRIEGISKETSLEI
jgi:hypothetical protein